MARVVDPRALKDRTQKIPGFKPPVSVFEPSDSGDAHEVDAFNLTIRKLRNQSKEYTPEQRKMLDGRLAQARRGPYHGPFETADDAVKFLRKEILDRKTRKRKPSRG